MILSKIPATKGGFGTTTIRVFDMRGNVLHTPPDFALIEELIGKLCAFANNDGGSSSIP